MHPPNTSTHDSPHQSSKLRCKKPECLLSSTRRNTYEFLKTSALRQVSPWWVTCLCKTCQWNTSSSEHSFLRLTHQVLAPYYSHSKLHGIVRKINSSGLAITELGNHSNTGRLIAARGILGWVCLTSHNTDMIMANHWYECAQDT